MSSSFFECVGLNKELIDRHFAGTPSRLQGIGLDDLDREVAQRHSRGFDEQTSDDVMLPFTGGQYQWRRRGELHKWNPGTIASLQHAARSNDATLFARYEQLADDESQNLMTLRGLLDLDTSASSVRLEEVEPAASIARRFVTGAMSFGSISAEAHETLAIAMNRIE